MTQIDPAGWPTGEVVSTIEDAVARVLVRRGKYREARFAKECSGGMGGLGPFETLREEGEDWTKWSVREMADHWEDICAQPEHDESMDSYPNVPPREFLPDSVYDYWADAQGPHEMVYAVGWFYNHIEAFQLAHALRHAREEASAAGIVSATAEIDDGCGADLTTFAGLVAHFLVAEYAGEFPEFPKDRPVPRY